MSGIDNPVKKFERVPRNVFDPIYAEHKERLRKEHEEYEAKRQARIIKEEEDKRRADEAFVNRELEMIMSNLEFKFNQYKGKLLGKVYYDETFEFKHSCNPQGYRHELWKIVAEKAKIAMNAVVIVDNYRYTDDTLSAWISFVDPKSAPVADAQQTQ
jgi:hypothetical protein